MKILVFIKKVPDTGIPLRVQEDGMDILRDASVTYVTNPYDEFALEEAIKIKEKLGSVEIVVASLGDEGTVDLLRNALALGTDRAVLLRYDRFHELDPHSTARTLLEYAQKEGFDLLIVGKEAVDDANGQVPIFIAEWLNLPHATFIAHLELSEQKVTIRREVDEGMETLEFPLPCVLTCEKGLNEPRLPTLRGIMAAKKKEIEEIQVTPPSDPKVRLVRLSLPPEKPPGRVITGEFPENVRELVRLLREEAKVI